MRIGEKLTKVIIVSPKDIYDYFTSVYPDWDTQIPVETINDMWSGLQNGSLSAESSIVVFTDAYLTDYADELSTAIATFSPEALVLVLFYDIDNRPQLETIVERKRRELNLPKANFYSVNAAADVGEEIYAAYVAYGQDVQNPDGQAAYHTPVDAAPAAEGVYGDIPQATNEVEYQAPVTASIQTATEHRGLVVASTSSKGGSGKTTVALCTASMIYHASRLAVEQGLRAKPLSVCIVDMDTRDGQIGFLLGQSVPTALNIFLATDKTPETIMQNLIFDERLGIHALLAPKRARTADYLSPEFYQDIIQKLRGMFDVVVLDTSVNYLDALLGKVVLPISDAVMFVTNLSVGSVYGMNRWMDEVTSPVENGGSGISKNKIGIVVNQSAPDLGIDQELLKHAAAGAELLVAIPLDSGSVIAASNHNRLSDIILAHPLISPAYYQIVQQLLPNEKTVAPMDVLSSSGVSAPVKNNVKPATKPVEKKKKGKGLFR